jgi:hypothetical protein
MGMTTRRVTPAHIPDADRQALRVCLNERNHTRWPKLNIGVDFQGGFAYVWQRPTGLEKQPLFRLRYQGSADEWGVASHQAGKYTDISIPGEGDDVSPEIALDYFCEAAEIAARKKRIALNDSAATRLSKPNEPPSTLWLALATLLSTTVVLSIYYFHYFPIRPRGPFCGLSMLWSTSISPNCYALWTSSGAIDHAVSGLSDLTGQTYKTPGQYFRDVASNRLDVGLILAAIIVGGLEWLWRKERHWRPLLSQVNRFSRPIITGIPGALVAFSLGASPFLILLLFLGAALLYEGLRLGRSGLVEHSRRVGQLGTRRRRRAFATRAIFGLLLILVIARGYWALYQLKVNSPTLGAWTLFDLVANTWAVWASNFPMVLLAAVIWNSRLRRSWALRTLVAIPLAALFFLNIMDFTWLGPRGSFKGVVAIVPIGLSHRDWEATCLPLYTDPNGTLTCLLTSGKDPDSFLLAGAGQIVIRANYSPSTSRRIANDRIEQLAKNVDYGSLTVWALGTIALIPLSFLVLLRALLTVAHRLLRADQDISRIGEFLRHNLSFGKTATPR